MNADGFGDPDNITITGLSVFSGLLHAGTENDVGGSEVRVDASTTGVGYCTAGTSASGCQPLLTAVGTPSATAQSGFHLHAAWGQPLGQRHELPVRRPAREARRIAGGHGDRGRVRRRLRPGPERPLAP